jgi:hypothetical protein
MPRAARPEHAASGKPAQDGPKSDGPPGRPDRTDSSADKRGDGRADKLTDFRAEFKFPGVPVYQLKVRDVSGRGAGVVVRADSDFLTLVAVGQELNVRMLSPRHTGPSGFFRCRIEHISELKKGRFKGHMVVGLSLTGKASSH